MKPVFILIAVTGVLILGGCGAVGVLEEENTELHDKVDSLSTVQHEMKQRVNYLESQNVQLDSRNKQLKQRIDQTGTLTPPEYTVTEDKPLYAQPVQATPVPQGGQPLQPAQNMQATQPTGSPQAISPSSGAAPWRAEQKAIQSGAANPQLQGKDTWNYNTAPGSGYNYRDNGPSTSPGGYTYNTSPEKHSSERPANWQYNGQPSVQSSSEYARKFDSRGEQDNTWNNTRTGTANTSTPPRPRVQPTQPVSPQATYERQAQEQLQLQGQPQPPSHIPSSPMALPPSRVNATRSEVARTADYSYLAKYQKGYDAYKAGQYTESIQILTDLSASSEVNSTSDNCDFWIAESYYALRDYQSAKVYYSRVLSYPRSDKSNEAGSPDSPITIEL